MTDQPQVENTEIQRDGLHDLVEIHDPEIDPQALMAEIRSRIEARRRELGYVAQTFPSFGDAIEMPEPPQNLSYSIELYHHLQQANLLYSEVNTEPFLTESSSLKIPILGRLWRLIRRQAHNLVLFYTNRTLAHQVTVNRHLVSVLNQLVAENEELRQTIAGLQEQGVEPGSDDNEA